MERIAVYAGSFDILTNGHMDVIERGANLFDVLYVAVTYNAAKSGGMFSVDERLEILGQATDHLPNVKVASFQRELTVKWAKQHGAQVLLRGMRRGQDFEEEREMHLNNRLFCSEIDTLVLLPSANCMHISSSLVRGLVNGVDGWEFDIGHLVSEIVWATLIQKYGNRPKFVDWIKMWRGLESEASLISLMEEYDRIKKRYDEPDRHYHNLDHVLFMLEEMESVRNLLIYPNAVQLVIWYHDMVMNRGLENERLSAIELASAFEKHVSGGVKRKKHQNRIDAMTQTILDTVHSGRVKTIWPDEPYLLDLDLLCLSWTPDKFMAYRQKVRKEYADASDEDFAAGTIAFCEAMLKRVRIYHTDYFHDLYEDQARKNLNKLIDHHSE